MASRQQIKIILLIFLLTTFTAQTGLTQSKNNNPLYQKNSVIIYADKALYNTIVLYDAKKDLQKLKQSEDTVQCPLSYTYYYNPLSLVGDCFSYEKGEYGQIACGPPGNFLSVITLNLKTRTSAKLTDLFEERLLVDALKKDKWILEKLDQNTIVEQLSLPTLLKRINEVTNGKFTETSFAISEYDSKKKSAAVRLVSSTNDGFDHYRYLQLGLWITPKVEIIKSFEAESNFYLGEFKNGLSAPKK